MITSHLSPFALLQVTAPGGALPGLLFQVAAVSAIIYFFMIRPQQKQRKQHEERLRNLMRGDMVVTSGGIVGEVVHMKDLGPDEKSMDDHVTIKSADSRLLIERGRIAKVLGVKSSASPSA